MTKPAATEPPPELIAQLQLALKFHKDNNFSQADSAYKKALKDYPGFPDVAHLAAIFYVQIGKTRYAITLLKKALQDRNNDFKIHKLLGRAHLEEGEFETALEHLGKAKALVAGDPETDYYLGLCFHKMARYDQALSHYKAALPGKTSLPRLLALALVNNSAEILIHGGHREECAEMLSQCIKEGLGDYDTLLRLAVAQGEGTPASISTLMNAILQQPERDEAKAFFAATCSTGRSPAAANAQIRDVVMHCLESRKVNHQDLGKLWLINFFQKDSMPRAWALLQTDNYEDFTKSFSDPATRTEFDDPFFLLGLKNIHAAAENLETLYTFMRRYFLNHISGGSPCSPSDLALVSAMAQQCFFNEYVFSVQDAEIAEIEKIKSRLESRTSFTESDAPLLLALGCYLPLLQLANAQTLQPLKNPPELREVVEIQVAEPLEERRLAKTIAGFGKISDTVSQDVKNQYEENPYPRWKSENILPLIDSGSVAPQYRKRRSILIAGCGTGKQIIQVATANSNADILAIDLSLSSLAYAKRKLLEYGMDKNVTLMQGDILALEKLNKKFDRIFCTGVLHHMKDPLAGLKILAAILEDRGIMKIALYSKTARHAVYETRRIIKEHGFSPDPAGIRQCREYIKSYNRTAEDKINLSRWKDFYALSDCRDLLFHVQETCYDLPEIKDMLGHAGLKLKEFVLPLNIRFDILGNHPKEAMQDIDVICEYEKNNPAAFSRMYQFLAVRN